MTLRDRLREHILQRAEADPQIVAAAVIGSLSGGEGDEWSDLDFTFGVDAEAQLEKVIADWTRDLVDTFGAVPLLDLGRGELVYHVFFFEDLFQLDLSFAPGRALRTGPAFRSLFGPYDEQPAPEPEPLELFGFAALYARHAQVGIARGQLWHAEHCVDLVREQSLTLACLRRGLPIAFAKGFDRLPEDLLATAAGSLVRAPEPDELRRALGAAVSVLLLASEGLGGSAEKLEPQLRALVA
jgi:hypothetical protein